MKNRPRCPRSGGGTPITRTAAAVALLAVAIAQASVVAGCRRGPPKSPAELVSKLRSGDSEDREDAAKDLRKYPNAPPEVLPHVFAALQSEREAEAYGEMLVTLGHWGLPAAQPYIEGSLGHQDEDVREAGEKALRMWMDRNPGRGPLAPGQLIVPPSVAVRPKRIMTPWNTPRVDGQVPDCWKDSTSKQVCGFNCVVNEGRVGCASTPYGHCSVAGADVRCVDGPTITVMGVGAASSKAPECKMGSDGMNACGYNCKLGSNVEAYCSSVPNGACALNADGTFSCP